MQGCSVLAAESRTGLEEAALDCFLPSITCFSA